MRLSLIKNRSGKAFVRRTDSSGFRRYLQLKGIQSVGSPSPVFAVCVARDGRRRTSNDGHLPQGGDLSGGGVVHRKMRITAFLQSRIHLPFNLLQMEKKTK